MATPIQPTSVLKGRDAERFLRLTENVSYDEKKQQFLDDCSRVYHSIKHEARD